jgi:hypothetical protein
MLTTQPQDGSAQVDYRLNLPDSTYLSFDPTKVSFSEAEISDDIYGRGTATHVFVTSDPSFLTSLKSGMFGANPVLNFRLGFGTAENIFWLPWQEHIIVDSYAKFEGIGSAAGHLIVIKSENNFARMRRSKRVLTRRGAISDMVIAIATVAGLDYVIEPTNGQFMLVQSFIDDVAFLFSRLVPRAINAAGIGDYLCYIKDNILHFHTLGYQTTLSTVNYYSGLGCSFEAKDLSESTALWDTGIAGVNVIVQDPVTGNSKQVASDPANVYKLASGIYDFDSVEDGSANIPYHLGYNPVLELNALAQSAYAKARRQTFKNTMTLSKLITVRHGDLLNVLVTQQTATASDTAGYYLVGGSFYSVKKGEVLSVYSLERGETTPVGAAIAVQNSENQLVPATTAPGLSPNIMSTQSSQITKGAGQTGSSSSFSTVMDPNTAPT